MVDVPLSGVKAEFLIGCQQHGDLKGRIGLVDDQDSSGPDSVGIDQVVAVIPD